MTGWVLIYFFLGSDEPHVTHGIYNTVQECQVAGASLKLAASTAHIITACKYTEKGHET